MSFITGETLYVIAYVKKRTFFSWRVFYGDCPLPLLYCQEACDRLNAKHPDIHHWPVDAEKANS